MRTHNRLRVYWMLALTATLCACASSAPVPTKGLPAASQLTSSGSLLYFSSGDYGPVMVYTFPEGQEVASFDVPGIPAGLCSDKQGNVFMAEPYGQKVEEYPHGATSPTATFDFPPSPYGCAVDEGSTYLAVANEAGSVGVFNLSTKESKPATYTYPGIESFFFCTYDDQGNLFVDGADSDAIIRLLELRKGESSLSLVKLGAKIPYSASIQWDGTYLAISDGGSNKDSSVLRVKVKNHRAKIHARVTLRGPEPYTSQFWIQGNAIISPENRSANVAWWSYPAGGQPTGIIYQVGYAFGVTISVAPSR